jgi:integration host factor subunit alpha
VWPQSRIASKSWTPLVPPLTDCIFELPPRGKKVFRVLIQVDRAAGPEYRLKNRNIVAPPRSLWGAKMAGMTITRADLSEVVYQKVGLSRTESAALVELVLRELTDCLARGENVKLSSFGSFVVRQKGRRIGRNPKTGEEVPIEPRKVMVFKPSNILKSRINDRHDKKR